MASEEERIVRILRVLVTIAVVLGVIAALLGTRPFRFFAVGFFAPAVWVYWRPRWAQIVIWIMWTTTLAMVPVLMVVDRLHELQTPTGYLMAGSLTVIVVALPFVRRLYKTPRDPREARIPAARVVRR